MIDPRYIALGFQAPIDLEEALHTFMLTHAQIEGIEETDSGAFRFYLPREQWEEGLQRELKLILEAHPDLRFLGAELMEERDWNAEWESSILPQQVTDDLIVTPSWKKSEVEKAPARYVLTIDPKMSFGTGHHETTRLCLRASEAIDVTGMQTLDIGTGSGLLAIYALARGAKAAVGIDTDPWSIENAEENRELNGVLPSQFEIRAGTLSESVLPDETFDLIFANIHRNVLIEIADEIRSHCNASANVILSGLLIYDADEVRAHFERTGFHFVRSLVENEWTALVFTAP